MAKGGTYPELRQGLCSWVILTAGDECKDFWRGWLGGTSINTCPNLWPIIHVDIPLVYEADVNNPGISTSEFEFLGFFLVL